MYLVCLRPMRRDQSCRRVSSEPAPVLSSRDLDRALQRARAELDLLRPWTTQKSGSSSGATEGPDPLVDR